jgi:hypothetical protein
MKQEPERWRKLREEYREKHYKVAECGRCIGEHDPKTHATYIYKK